MKGKIARIAAISLVWLLGTMVVAEVVMRLLDPAPRIQVVRKPRLTSLDGVPYWEESTGMHNEECLQGNPGARRILVLGDSIFYGCGVDEAKVFTSLLQERLNREFPEPGFCVLNYSQPGFSGQQKLAAALHLVPRIEPELVLWEIWGTENDEYTFLGSSAYNLSRAELDEYGYPNVFGLPGFLNRLLFDVSALYEYASLTLVKVDTSFVMPDFVSVFERRMDRLAPVLRASGSRIVFVPCPPLDRPFDAKRGDSHVELVVKYLGEHGFDFIDLGRALEGFDVREIRQDECCHYNEAGHRAIAAVLYGPLSKYLGLDRKSRD